jgi:hypothetical protein
MTEIISFLFDEYVTKIYMVVDFVKPMDNYNREIYFFCFFASSLFTIVLTLASSVKYFSDFSSSLKDIFDHFLKLISALFNFVLLLIAPPFAIVIWLFMGAFIVWLLCGTFLFPLSKVIVDYKYNTLIEQIYVFLHIWIPINFAFFLIGILSLILKSINSYLLGDEHIISLTRVWIGIKEIFSSKVFSKNYVLNFLCILGLSLLIFLPLFVLFGFISVPLGMLGVINLIILPFALTRFLFRGLVRAIRS